METATQIISDIPQGNIIMMLRHISLKVKNKTPTSTYRGGDVYQLGDDRNGYVVLVHSDKVVYFVRYMLIKHNALRLGRQVLVWSDKRSDVSVGFAKNVFFKYLLPKYTALIADQQQTENGRRFWMYALDFAFEQNLNVYFLDRRSNPNQLIDLKSPEDVAKYRNALWGTDQGHKRTFAVISNKQLKIKEA